MNISEEEIIMSNIEIAWLELFSVGGVGLLLIIFAILARVKANRDKKLCINQTKGIVMRYGYTENGVYPILEYYVDGVRYKTKKKFNSIRTIQATGISQPDIYEDEKGNLHIKVGMCVGWDKLASMLWPINSTMTVYYNPKKPKHCYVDRPISNSFVVTMFIIMGIGIIILSILVFFNIYRR